MLWDSVQTVSRTPSEAELGWIWTTRRHHTLFWLMILPKLLAIVLAAGTRKAVQGGQLVLCPARPVHLATSALCSHVAATLRAPALT